MYLSVIQNYKNRTIFDLSNLEHFDMVGVIGGVIWTFGTTSEKDGTYKTLSWESSKVNSPGTLSISILEKSNNPTEPESIQESSVQGLQEELTRLSNEMEANLGKISETKNTEKKTQKHKFIKRNIKVLKDGDAIFDFTGEHIQFEIKCKVNEGCTIDIWGYEDYENQTASNKRYSNPLSEKECVLKFGS